MKTFAFFSIAITICVMVPGISFGQSFVADDGTQYEFISPYPGSEYHNINARIIIRQGELLDMDMLQTGIGTVSITGSESGSHASQFWLASDGKTLQIQSEDDFALEEEVSIHISGLKVLNSDSALPALDFSFVTSERLPAAYNVAEWQNPYLEGGEEEDSGDRDYPLITQITNTNPSPGHIFMHTTGTAKYVAILDSAASPTPLWFMPSGLNGNDFKVNGNEKITLFNRTDFDWIVMDEFTNFVDTLSMIGGYTCDDHECLVLPNNHIFMQSYDAQIVDMSVVVPGGNSQCLVYGLVIQELDENMDLLMEWRSWDFLYPTESFHLNLTAAELDLWHGNSIEEDYDGNLLFSLRNIDTVLKVDRQTGEIIWRLGNSPNADFDFTNDAGFTYQHDARRLDNGHITIFNNGNYSNPQLTRIVEYSIDEVNMTATRVFEFYHPDNLFAPSTGNVQVLPNGNYFINWGNVINDNWGARVTEVTPAGEIVLEYAFPLGYNTYRAFKKDWFFDSSIVGCSDPEALNYDPNQPIINNESCIYADDADNDNDGYSTVQGDCDDNNNSIYPGAVEIPYNGIDEDCSGEDLTDVDNDGVSFPEDCDDNNSAVYPGAVEIPYNGIDEDCSGEDLTDVDNDGVSFPEDCDDNNSAVYPGAVEIPYNGIDEDCSGEDLTDVDNDGVSFPEDCDDNNGAVYPGAVEIPYNGIDEDCSGADLTDVDNDGFDIDADCNDNDDSIYPGADEIIGDGIDQDCNGSDLTSITENGALSFVLFPNPAQEWMIIQFDFATSNRWITVNDALGRTVFSEMVSGSRVYVDCSAWNRGLYTLRLHGEKNEVQRFMIR